MSTGVKVHAVQSDAELCTMCLQVLHSHMNKEMESARSTFTVFDLLRTPAMRRISICLLAVWLDTHLLTCSPSAPAYLFT